MVSTGLKTDEFEKKIALVDDFITRRERDGRAHFGCFQNIMIKGDLNLLYKVKFIVQYYRAVSTSNFYLFL